MKNKFYSQILLILFGLPFPFISMYLDFKFGTMIGYLIMIGAYIALVYGCQLINEKKVNLYGNAISVVISLFFIQRITFESWSYYFNPLTPYQLLIFLAALGVLIQFSAGYFINRNLEK